MRQFARDGVYHGYCRSTCGLCAPTAAPSTSSTSDGAPTADPSSRAPPTPPPTASVVPGAPSRPLVLASSLVFSDLDAFDDDDELVFKIALVQILDELSDAAEITRVAALDDGRRRLEEATKTTVAFDLRVDTTVDSNALAFSVATQLIGATDGTLEDAIDAVAAYLGRGDAIAAAVLDADDSLLGWGQGEPSGFVPDEARLRACH